MRWRSQKKIKMLSSTEIVLMLFPKIKQNQNQTFSIKINQILTRSSTDVHATFTTPMQHSRQNQNHNFNRPRFTLHNNFEANNLIQARNNNVTNDNPEPLDPSSGMTYFLRRHPSTQQPRT